MAPGSRRFSDPSIPEVNPSNITANTVIPVEGSANSTRTGRFRLDHLALKSEVVALIANLQKVLDNLIINGSSERLRHPFWVNAAASYLFIIDPDGWHKEFDIASFWASLKTPNNNSTTRYYDINFSIRGADDFTVIATLTTRGMLANAFDRVRLPVTLHALLTKYTEFQIDIVPINTSGTATGPEPLSGSFGINYRLSP